MRKKHSFVKILQFTHKYTEYSNYKSIFICLLARCSTTECDALRIRQ